MSTITQVTASYSYTYNLGDYKSIRPEVTLTAILEEGDDPEGVRATLQIEARLSVQDQVDDELIRLGRMPHFDKDRAEKIKQKRREELDEVPF